MHRWPRYQLLSREQSRMIILSASHWLHLEGYGRPEPTNIADHVCLFFFFFSQYGNDRLLIFIAIKMR